MEPRDVGHRAMAANLSDVAAMGARPVLAVVALGVAATTPEAWILEAYRGMASLAHKHGAAIVGGDLTRSPALTLAITVVGEVAASRLKRRDGGRAGDVVAVTGTLGRSRAGLEMQRRDAAVSDEARARALRAYRTPEPRVREGRWLAASANVHALMDSSDGLSTDLTRLANASGCGALIDAVPVDPVADEIARAVGDDPVGYALDGGEDYELLTAVAPRAFARLSAAFQRRFGRPLLRVGNLRPGSGLALAGARGERTLRAAGWDHLA